MKNRPTWKQADAFETYLLMGEGRTLSKLSKLCKVTPTTLSHWAKAHNWHARCLERDKKAMARLEAENDNTLVLESKKRHIALYQKIQNKSEQFLNTHEWNKWDTMKDAAIAADISIKGEREVMGLRDTKLRAGFMTANGFAAVVEAVVGAGNGIIRPPETRTSEKDI